MTDKNQLRKFYTLLRRAVKSGKFQPHAYQKTWLVTKGRPCCPISAILINEGKLIYANDTWAISHAQKYFGFSNVTTVGIVNAADGMGKKSTQKMIERIIAAG